MEAFVSANDYKRMSLILPGRVFSSTVVFFSKINLVPKLHLLVD